MSEKMKFEELVSNVSEWAVLEALASAKRSYKDYREDDWKKLFGLTDYQYQLFLNALNRNLSAELQGEIDATLIAGDSVEFPKSFNVRKYVMTRTDSTGKPISKLSISTRERMKQLINQ